MPNFNSRGLIRTVLPVLEKLGKLYQKILWYKNCMYFRRLDEQNKKKYFKN